MSKYAPGELRNRVVYGFAGAIVATFFVTWSNWGLWLTLLVISCFMFVEYLMLSGKVWYQADVLLWVATVLGFWVHALLWSVYPSFTPEGTQFGMGEWLSEFGVLLVQVLPGLFFITASYQLFRGNGALSMASLGVLFSGFFYVIVPFLVFYSLCSDADLGKHWVLSLGLIMQVWAFDIAAFFGGKAFGRHLLLPRVSPQKTWEGVLLGSCGALVLAACWYVLGPKVQFNWFFIAFIVSVFAPLGDLVESQLKRSAGVKDSGKLLPGHGGMLDRFDSFLLTLPVIYLYLRLWVS